jgi:tetracycline repressor-like protein
VVGVGGREPQLLEDALHVLLDGALRDHELTRDRGVRPSLRHHGEGGDDLLPQAGNLRGAPDRVGDVDAEQRAGAPPLEPGASRASMNVAVRIGRPTSVISRLPTVGSKEELQLATVETANAVFADQVIQPAEQASGGLERLRLLADGYLGYVESGTFAGGCFFASALSEVDMHPGPVRDVLVAFNQDWMERLEAAAHDAQAEGTIDPAEDVGQLAFDLEAALYLANAQFVVARTSEPIERARAAIEQRLQSIANTD